MTRILQVLLRKILTSAVAVAMGISLLSCAKPVDNGNGDGDNTVKDPAGVCLQRSITIADAAFAAYFEQSGMAMSRYYNPSTGVKSSEKGSVWMYTSAIEATTAILNALKAQKEAGNSDLYAKYFDRYSANLAKLFSGLEYYGGTYSLTSFTQTASWSVYGVNRGASMGSANVEGRENVYDDQMWLVRELIEAWRATGDARYLEKAEYLTSYVLDGWDCTISDGVERGGITWGPGYYSKHSCSNGPIISPCVWLHEIYKDKSDEITYRYIDAADGRTRKSQKMSKADFYLMFARKIYHWQRQYLRNSRGVYEDNLNTPDIGGNIQYETVDGERYRKPANLRSVNGPAFTYNCGSMLSGAADLYRVTGDAEYLTDMKNLTDASFKEFASPVASKPGYYNYPMDGFSIWFNGVLMRAYVEADEFTANAALPVESFRKSLDYGFENHLKDGLLPKSLLFGWSMEASKNNMEGMFEFTYASEFAVLSRHLSKK